MIAAARNTAVHTIVSISRYRYRLKWREEVPDEVVNGKGLCTVGLAPPALAVTDS